MSLYIYVRSERLTAHSILAFLDRKRHILEYPLYPLESLPSPSKPSNQEFV
jgi:hypothetical protein